METVGMQDKGLHGAIPSNWVGNEEEGDRAVTWKREEWVTVVSGSTPATSPRDAR